MKKNVVNEEYYNKLSDEFKKHNIITNDMFAKYHVKRGLRNSDGTGVVAGVTQVCNVHGYLLDEGERIAIDGELTYSGYSIRDLVYGCQKENRTGFEEVIYLLIMGVLPNNEELKEFKKTLGTMRLLPKYFPEDVILRVPSPNVMNNIARSVLALYAYDKNAEDTSIVNTVRQSLELCAKLPIMAAYAYQAKNHFHDKESLYIHFPKPELSTAENILYMIRPDSNYTEEEVRILDLCLMIHAEHGGGNNSTFTTRVLTSSGTDIYSTIASAVSSLKGPKHGGANLKVAEMLDEIKQNVKNWDDEEELTAYVRKILNKEAYDKSGLFYGVGHAVYSKSDPRTVILRENVENLARINNRLDELKLMDRTAKIAQGFFYEKYGRHMCINVDYYSGFVYDMLGIPKDLYTPLFAIARVSGWCAHRLEELANGKKIIRPAYKSVIPKFEYIPIDERK